VQDRAAAKKSYDRMSRVYGLLSGGSEKRLVEFAVDNLLKPAPGEVVLEAGFGTGRVLAALADRVGDSGRVYGIDLSEGMVEASKKRLDKLGLSERPELTCGDAAAMPYPDGLFDAVFMSFTLELFPDDEIPVVLDECARVLKSGGRLCAACMSSEGRNGAMMKLYAWSHRRFPNFVDCRPIHARLAVEEAGFRIDTVRVMSMWGLPVELVLAGWGQV